MELKKKNSSVSAFTKYIQKVPYSMVFSLTYAEHRQYRSAAVLDPE